MCLFNRKGFTLVELMMVVAIIGILAAIGISQYQVYQSKTKTIEAKVGLASLYDGQIGHYSEYDYYSPCINTSGIGQSSTENYYAIGFNNVLANHLGWVPNVNGSSCGNTLGDGISSYPQRHTVGGNMIAFDDISAAAITDNTNQTFLAEACGNIERDHGGNGCGVVSADNPDTWHVDQDKNFTHTTTGY